MKTIARGLPVAPPNIGPKTFPNYDTFVNGAIRSLDDGTKVFVGQRDDPFFVDLGATFDGLNVRKLTGNQGEGKDDLSGIQHPLDRHADPGAAGDARTSKAVAGRGRRQRGRGRVVHHRAQAAPGDRQPALRHASTAAGSRSRASATRW